MDKISQSLEGINNFFSRVGEIMNNPFGELCEFLYSFFKECLETISIVSYEWLILIGLIALVLSIFGSDKGKKIGMLCPVIYVIIQILAKAVCHV